MSERRILVVGSQCLALGKLSFLPRLSEEFYHAMTDPALGNCIPVFDDTDKSLLCDPTVLELKARFRMAFEIASERESTLFLIYIGHGTYAGNDFFLLPKDAEADPTADSGVHLVNQITDLYRKFSNIDGLVVLIDTCYGGYGAQGAADRWTKGLDSRLRFELLTASGQETAADGCFSQSVIQAIRNGVPSVAREKLRCDDLHKIVTKACANQRSQHPAYNVHSDDELYVSKNRRLAERSLPWIDSVASSQIERLTSYFEPAPQLEILVEAIRDNRAVIVQGDAGSGKSTLAAALSYPGVTGGIVPPSLVQAIVFLDEGTTPDILARRLVKQLQISVPNFEAAQKSFEAFSDRGSLDKFSALHRYVIGPLAVVNAIQPIRLILDGLDCLTPESSRAIQLCFEEILSNPALSHVHLLGTCREDLGTPRAKFITLGKVEEEQLLNYLCRRDVPENAQPVIVQKADGNWLVARLLCEQVIRNPDLPPERLSGETNQVYDASLEELGCGDPETWKSVGAILKVLAVSGVGPNLPIRLLSEASSRLGGPSRPFAVRNSLARIRPFIVRSASGTDDERCGLFHQTFVSYLLDPLHRFGVDSKLANSAMVKAIDALAPPEECAFNRSNGLCRYAAAVELEHLWGADQADRLLASLQGREPQSPADAVARWQAWTGRIESKLGSQHRDTITVRHRIAVLTGSIGDVEMALKDLRELFTVSADALGADDPLTLQIRADIAYFLWDAGHPEDALHLFQELLPHGQRVLGPRHPQTLELRNNVAFMTGSAGDSTEAVRLFQSLLEDQRDSLGTDNLNTLVTRNNIAHWTGECGDVQGALKLYEKLLPDQLALLGPDHEDTLLTRQNIASWKREAGSLAESLRLSKSVLPDRIRVLGETHPQTLVTRAAIAVLVGETGNIPESIQLLYDLLRDTQRVHGANHPETLEIRARIAIWTAKGGGLQKGLQLFEEVLADQSRVLGEEHPVTLKTREYFASTIGQYVDKSRALELFEQHLKTMQRRCSVDDPQLLNARKQVAHWTAETGNKTQALAFFGDLLRDEMRVLSAHHPAILKTRRSLAYLMHDTDPDFDVVSQLTEILHDQEQILGLDHPDTVETLQALKSISEARPK